MRHFNRLFFSAAGLMAASLTIGTLGAGAAWASGNGNGNGNDNANGKAGANSNGSANGNQPPGNNGTVKIDEIPVDGQGNDPHVSCGFAVTFWGYDGGQPDYATISITPVAPTSGGHTFTTSTSWQVATRTGGSQLDQQVPITAQDLAPALAGVTPQAQQGYHLRLEVEVTGSQGSDDKYKVFWMQPCSASPSSSGSSSGTPPTTPPTTVKTVAPAGGKTGNGPTTTTAPASDTAGSVASSSSSLSSTAGHAATLASGSAAATVSRSAGAAQPASLAAGASGPVGVQSDQAAAVPAATQAPSGGSLAFTGAAVGVLVLVGLGLIGAGLLLTRRWRRAKA